MKRLIVTLLLVAGLLFGSAQAASALGGSLPFPAPTVDQWMHQVDIPDIEDIWPG